MTARHVVSPFPRTDHRHDRCRTAALSHAEHSCAARGTRLTDLRRRVLGLVWGSHGPVKAYEILRRLRGGPGCGAPPTVYRALDFLCREGLVHRIESLNAFVGCGAPGHVSSVQFLICRRCGTAAEIADAGVTRRLGRRASELDFAVDVQTVEIRGLCRRCRPARRRGRVR
ncbi:MAG: transcriptional repressor [Gammaproteobacteria bacterium]|nr:transcriptional repressor [Gammaproteobacteria bacterium]